MNIVTAVWLLSITYSGTDIELINATYASQSDCVLAAEQFGRDWSKLNDLRTLKGRCQETEVNLGVGL